MPSMPNKRGIATTAPHSKIKVREKEMMAEITPLFRAVKSDEV
jgi:hypothetical protein